MTKLKFFTVCTNITKLVTLSSLKVIIPGLVRRLAKDPDLLMPSQESGGYVNIIGTSHPSITYIENDQGFIKLKDGVLTKVIPELSSGRSSVQSDKSPRSLHSASEKRYVVQRTVNCQYGRLLKFK